MLVCDIYEVADACQGDRYSGWALPGVELMVFTERDIERHTQRRKEVSGLYANSVIYNLERPLDRVVEALLDKLSHFAATSEVIEMFDWLHYFTIDAIGVFTVCTWDSL